MTLRKTMYCLSRSYGNRTVTKHPVVVILSKEFWRLGFEGSPLAILGLSEGPPLSQMCGSFFSSKFKGFTGDVVSTAILIVWRES